VTPSLGIRSAAATGVLLSGMTACRYARAAMVLPAIVTAYLPSRWPCDGDGRLGVHSQSCGAKAAVCAVCHASCCVHLQAEGSCREVATGRVACDHDFVSRGDCKQQQQWAADSACIFWTGKNTARCEEQPLSAPVESVPGNSISVCTWAPGCA
jgi:hypothetical protein